MPNIYELPLKVLWTWNFNESEIAIEFLLKPDGKYYQIKGAGKDAFNENGELKVCTTENIEQLYYLSPNKKVIIADGSKLKKIWNYWKEGGGEIKYNAIIKEHLVQREKENISPLAQMQPAKNQPGDIELKRTQVYNLAFEIDFLVQMQISFKGFVSLEQIESLITVCSEGFSESTKNNIREELKNRGVLNS